MKVTLNGKSVGQWPFWLATLVWGFSLSVSVSVGLNRDAGAFVLGVVAAYLILRAVEFNDRALA